MKSTTSSKLRYFALGAAVMLALEGVAHLVAAHAQTLPSPGPIPGCFSRPATHVLVDKTVADYSSWEAQGVVVQDTNETDGSLTGTVEADVLVALVSTRHNGIFSAPKWRAKPADGGSVAGDRMCQKVGPTIMYGSAFADHMMSTGTYAEGVHDDYYLGGCKRAPADVQSDHTGPKWAECDELFAGPGMDKVWGGFVPAGYHQHVVGQDGQDHLYVGGGLGQVEVMAGLPTRRAVCPDTGPCQPGDHIHPCNKPAGSVQNFIKVSVEYVGPESAFTSPPLSLVEQADPCAYEFEGGGP